MLWWRSARHLGFGGPGSPAAAFPRWTSSWATPASWTCPITREALKFAELMKERTGGAVTVHVFPANQLGSEKDMVEQVKNGVIHISLTGPSMLAQFKGWGPIGVLGMPYVLKGDTEDELRPKLIKLARGSPHDRPERAGRRGERHPHPGHGLVVRRTAPDHQDQAGDEARGRQGPEDPDHGFPDGEGRPGRPGGRHDPHGRGGALHRPCSSGWWRGRRTRSTPSTRTSSTRCRNTWR